MEAATLIVTPIECDLSPTEVARRLCRDDGSFALIGDWAGRGALIGSSPVWQVVEDGDPFALLDVQPVVQRGDASDGAIGGGWFGYLGYQLGSRIESLPPAPARPIPLPAFALGFYDHVLRFDSDHWWFEALVTDPRTDALRAREREVRALLASDAPPRQPFRCGTFTPTPSRGAHLKAVAATLDRVSAGEIYQANITLRFDASASGDPLDLFCRGVERAAPARAAFLRGAWGAVSSLSPELFLVRDGRQVTSAPIKGTRRRVGTEAEAMRAELERSEKDRAENLMIVDLMRNDLGRVCEPGTVRAPDLFRTEAHPGVWHLVSRVTGTLRDGATDSDLLRATFPPGSVTGTPKIRAMETISELEATAREVYTGAIGFASPDRLELNVAIRTFEHVADRAWFGVGGGIVADSDPEAEYDECLAKASNLLDAARATISDA